MRLLQKSKVLDEKKGTFFMLSPYAIKSHYKKLLAKIRDKKEYFYKKLKL